MHYGAEHTYGARANDSWSYRGLRVAVIENELLRAVVLADKGADIYSLVHKPTDTEFMWRSPWGVRNPTTYVPTTAEPNSLWADFYEGGWQSVFPGGGYYSRYRGADLGLHAEANLLPWDVELVEEGPERAAIRFGVRLARTPFVASRTLTIDRNSPTLVVRETLTNVGGEEFPVSYGQHITFGPPFLSEHCVFDLPGGTVHNHPVEYSPNHRLLPDARSPWPHAVLKDGSRLDLRKFPPPGAGFEDQSYIEDLIDGWYAVTNTQLGVGVAVRFPHELYRYLWYWQVFSGGSGYPWWGQNYNVGIEPFTSATNRGVLAAIDDGSAVTLPAGATIESEIKVTAFTSRSGVKNVNTDGAVELRDSAS